MCAYTGTNSYLPFVPCPPYTVAKKKCFPSMGVNGTPQMINLVHTV